MQAQYVCGIVVIGMRLSLTQQGARWARTKEGMHEGPQLHSVSLSGSFDAMCALRCP